MKIYNLFHCKATKIVSFTLKERIHMYEMDGFIDASEIPHRKISIGNGMVSYTLNEVDYVTISMEFNV